jgi:hypothetical protein
MRCAEKGMTKKQVIESCGNPNRVRLYTKDNYESFTFEYYSHSEYLDISFEDGDKVTEIYYRGD